MRTLASLALVVFGLAACRDSDGGGGKGKPDASVNTEDVTIQELQSDEFPACDTADPATCVEIKVKGVIVTAIDTFGNRKGEDIWVQEPGGGPYSGIQIYRPPLDQIAGLAVGDIVDIAGAVKKEHAHPDDTSGNTLTELAAFGDGTLTITKVGSGAPPEPQVVDALAIGQMTDYMARHAEWEKWEGVLIKLTNVEAFSTTRCITSQGNCNDPTYEAFDITGDIAVQSSLAAMPDPKVARGDCLASVTGVVSYFFDYQILPRTTDEIATGGTECPRENDATTCSDGVDNNGNGFKDCDDFSCREVPACSVQTTVADVQMGTATGVVRLENVVITARDTVGGTRGVFVADALQAAPYNGVFVYMGNANATIDASLVVGAVVNVTGTVTEFDVNPQSGDTLTELTNATVTLVSAPADPPVPLTGVAITTLSDIGAAGEPYEGVLVQLSTLKVTNNALGNKKVELTDNNGDTIIMDDDIFGYDLPANDTCYATVTGIMSVQLNDDLRTINPRSADDLVVGTGCN